MEYSLQYNHVFKQYENFQMKDVTFGVPMGSIMGLIGENGAGKTTLIKMGLNLTKPDSGEITVMGYNNIQKEKNHKSLIGYVPDVITVFDMFLPKDINKIMKGIYKNWDEKQYYDYLERLEIPRYQQVKDFSLGMKKKLMIASALSHKARMLILDEPMSGLDPVARNEILDIFLGFIQDDENSILLSSHITDDLEKICDYITFIHKGNIIFSKNKDSVLEEYGLLKCKKEEIKLIDKDYIVEKQDNAFGCTLLVKNKKYMQKKYPDCVMDSVNLEDIMIFYARREKRC